MAIQIGDILGDYQVTGVLGRGGMGKVYRVRSLLTEREEAMKVVLPERDDEPALLDRFLREIKVHASLQHPNIAALHTALRIEDRIVMILELVEGVTLEEMLRHGAVPIATAVHYMYQVLAALEFAHQRGVTHRDIKPANILIASGGVVKLTDFGIARSTGGPRLTGVGMAVGTLAYMSPEQIRSAPVDARSDIYSLGLTFYETVTGHAPIQGETEHAVMNAQLSVIPPEPGTLNALLPRPLSAAIMRAIAKAPGDRFQSAREFQAAVQDFAQPGQGPGSPSASPALTPELLELETRLSRALGPIAKHLVADAARRYGSVSEIRRVLAAQIGDPAERDAFLRNKTEQTVTMLSKTPTPGTTFDATVLERLTAALAPYIGPVAKVVVARASRTARNAAELQTVLAEEISSAADRQKFLAVARSFF